MYNILIVDDAKDAILLLQHDLQQAGFNVITANDGKQCLTIVKQQAVDMILLDIHMPNLSGLAVLKQLKSSEHSQNIPVLMLSASDLEDDIVTALELGAYDYITKPYMRKVLLARIQNTFTMVEKNAQLEYLAQKDFLTGINNRRNFYQLAKKLVSISKRHQQSLIVAMCDIDLFKQVNDLFGHDAGDTALVELSKVLANMFRDSDVIGRLGGEEFALCLPQISLQEALVACERLRNTIEKMVITKDECEFSITMSIGITCLENNEQTLANLLKQADQALYNAKQNGRNQIAVFSNT